MSAPTDNTIVNPYGVEQSDQHYVTLERPKSAEELRMEAEFQRQVAEAEANTKHLGAIARGEVEPDAPLPSNVTSMPERPQLSVVKEPIPDFLDLDDRDEEIGGRTVKVQGSTLHIVPITVGASRKMGWYQAQINSVTAKMNAETREDKAMEQEALLKKLQEKLTIALIPEFPIGVLDNMPIGKYKRLMDYVNKIVEEDMGDDTANPN